MEKYKEIESKGEKKMRGKYLNPKADLTFKLVFGEHPDLVMKRVCRKASKKVCRKVCRKASTPWLAI